MKKPRILSGFRDSTPSEMIERLRMMRAIREVFESYAYDPIETPSLEYYETLAGKEGGDSEMLMYDFHDHGDRHVGLIYDLTVPIARMIATNQDIPLPLKRYQIQRVWRADRPQKGRFREFYQCDVDILGDDSLAADAEIITVISKSLEALGFVNFEVRVSSRELLNAMLINAGVSQETVKQTIIAIDKLDKIGANGVACELNKLGVSSPETIIEMISGDGDGEDKLTRITDTLVSEEGKASALKIARIIELARLQGGKAVFDPSLARGQTYYTGPVFEANLTGIQFGSLAGGGRYDNLVGMFLGKPVPAVGASLGFDRILSAMRELGLTEERPSFADVYVMCMEENHTEYALKVADSIRKLGLRVMMGYIGKKMKWHMKHAIGKGVKHIAIIGEDEYTSNSVTIKNTITRDQESLNLENLKNHLSRQSC
jgi:histidyl-tRNA synthetase